MPGWVDVLDCSGRPRIPAVWITGSCESICSNEIHIGKVRLLRTLMRLSPGLGYRMLRDS